MPSTGWVGGVGLLISLEVLMAVVYGGTFGRGGRLFPPNSVLRLV